MALRRILKELQDAACNPPDSVRLFPVPDSDGFKLLGVIRGPENSPYAGGFFEVSLELPGTYPFKAPNGRLLTPVYSCNVNTQGSYCIDAPNWSPGCTLVRHLASVWGMLADPNPDDPLRPDIAGLYKRDRVKYNSLAREWTERHAINGLGDKYALYTVEFGKERKEKLR